MNAALQALSNCSPLREYFCSFLTLPSFLSEDFSSSDSLLSDSNGSVQVSRPLTVAFKDIINRLWSDDDYSSITPTFFLFVRFKKIFLFFNIYF